MPRLRACVAGLVCAIVLTGCLSQMHERQTGDVRLSRDFASLSLGGGYLLSCLRARPTLSLAQRSEGLA